MVYRGQTCFHVGQCVVQWMSWNIRINLELGSKLTRDDSILLNSHTSPLTRTTPLHQHHHKAEGLSWSVFRCVFFSWGRAYRKLLCRYGKRGEIQKRGTVEGVQGRAWIAVVCLWEIKSLGCTMYILGSDLWGCLSNRDYSRLSY